MILPKLHFITQPNTTYSNHELVEKVCLSGVKFIQLRIKEQSLESIYEEAKKVKKICQKFQAVFIINDHVTIAKELNLDGVHLGKSDMTPTKARQILGDKAIIGGTANKIEDIIRLVDARVDYIGLGPFSYTNTKKKLSPILGLSGYKKIFNRLIKNKSDLPPIYAIGGITKEDIKPLMSLGVYGVAVSGLIANSKHISDEIKSINQLLDNEASTQ